MKLYDLLLSPNCLRVRLVIAELGLAPEIVQLDMAAGENRSPEFLALNPNGKAPTLVHGDLVVWESRAIAAYLAGLKPESGLYPTEPSRRAHVDQWAYWQAMQFGPVVQKIVFERAQKQLFGRGEPDDAAIAGELQSLPGVLAVLDGALAGREWIAGAYSLADMSLAGSLVLRDAAGIALADYPNIEAWLQRIEGRPAWQEVIVPYVEALRARGLKV